MKRPARIAAGFSFTPCDDEFAAPPGRRERARPWRAARHGVFGGLASALASGSVARAASWTAGRIIEMQAHPDPDGYEQTTNASPTW
jgi:hypothetical protein